MSFCHLRNKYPSSKNTPVEIHNEHIVNKSVEIENTPNEIQNETIDFQPINIEETLIEIHNDPIDFCPIENTIVEIDPVEIQNTLVDIQNTLVEIKKNLKTPQVDIEEKCPGFKQKTPVAYYNTQFIDNFSSFQQGSINYNTPIYQRNPIVCGRLSLNHLELLEYFVRLLKPKVFLELGIQYGECTHRLIDLIPRYYGVDISRDENIDILLKNKPNFTFYKSTSNEFFKEIKKQGRNLNLDMAFIDADHSHTASYQDFLNIQEHLNEDGFIFFHDCYPSSIAMTHPNICGDCYLTSEIIRKNHHDNFEILTLPVFPGISIARKCTKQLFWL